MSKKSIAIFDKPTPSLAITIPPRIIEEPYTGVNGSKSAPTSSSSTISNLDDGFFVGSYNSRQNILNSKRCEELLEKFSILNRPLDEFKGSENSNLIGEEIIEEDATY